MPDDLNQAEEQLRQLEALARGGGYADRDTLARARQLVRDLRFRLGQHAGSGYAREKLTSLEGHFADLYSDWKHRQYDTGAQAGADRVRQLILQDLAALEMHLRGVRAALSSDPRLVE